MDERVVDVAIIGAGTAGLHARNAVAQSGARTLLIESGPWGTTCVRTGCMPSKLLLAAARSAREVRDAAAFGVHAEPRIDGRAVMTRLHALRARFLSSIHEEIDAVPADEKLEGHARFLGPDTLLVGERVRVQARAIIIATGSRPAVPDALRPLEHVLLTSETVFELDELPASLAVLGAGPLGLELAFAFARLGVRTALFDTGESVGGLRDPEVSAAARRLVAEEISLHLGVEPDATTEGDEVRLRWEEGGRSRSATFARLLVATGRPPNPQGLALESSGLPLDEHGLPHIDPQTLRCGTAPVFLAGDVDHRRPVLHEATSEGERAGVQAAAVALGRPAPPAPPRAAALSIAFTDPDMASIGAPLSDLGPDAAVGASGFAVGRGLIDGQEGGLMRLYAQRKDRVVAGGEMVGPAVEHLAHLVAAMVQARMSVEQALALPFYHPTYEEQLKNGLKSLAAALG